MLAVDRLDSWWGTLGRNRWLPLAALGVALLATAAVYALARAHVASSAREHFVQTVLAASTAIDRQMLVYELGVLGADGALHAGRAGPSAEDWRRYAAGLRLGVRYPAVRAVGFLPAGGPRATTPAYVEPDDRTARAALSAALRNEMAVDAALSRARDLGSVSASLPVALDSSAAQAPEAGVVLFGPVYRAGDPSGTPAERRAALVGWVAALVAVDVLVAESLRGQHDDVGLAVRDADPAAPALFLRAGTIGSDGWLGGGASLDLVEHRRVHVGGRTWDLEFRASSQELAGPARREPLLVLLGGVLISALSYAVLRSSWRLQSRAAELARGMTDALRASEERYALAMTASDEGHWDWDIARDRLYLSPKARDLFDLPADYESTSFAAFQGSHRVVMDDCPALETALHAHLDGRTPRLECEYRVDTCGGVRWLLSRGQCVQWKDGRAVRMAGSVVDVTERRRAECERRRLEESLRQAQKREALGTLAGGIAHDFNNVLGAIVGYGELAQQVAPAGTPSRRYADRILEAALRARALVDRVLSLSGTGGTPGAVVHLQPNVREALRTAAATAPAAVRVRSRLRAPDLHVRGDAERVRTVVAILWTNAVQSMPEGGHVDVVLARVELTDPQAIATGVLQPGTYARLTVRDDGIGIDDRDLRRVFDPFFTTRGVGQGTGLGLPMLSTMVAELGGGVDVASRPGAGSTFDVYLPVDGRRPGTEPEVVPPGRGAVVMLVDDEPALVNLGEELLATLGYEPVGFGSGEAALAAARGEPRRFDLVLTDEKMPGLSGCELAVQLRSAGVTAPVVVMSGYGGPALRERARAAGVRTVLAKPLRSAELAHALADALAPGAALQP